MKSPTLNKVEEPASVLKVHPTILFSSAYCHAQKLIWKACMQLSQRR